MRVRHRSALHDVKMTQHVLHGVTVTQDVLHGVTVTGCTAPLFTDQRHALVDEMSLCSQEAACLGTKVAVWQTTVSAQGPFCLQDFQAWVKSGHFVDSMQVYHVEDTTTAHTLAQLFSQQACPQAPSEPQAPLTSPPDPTLNPHLAPNGVSTVPPTSSSQRYYQNHWQQEDLAPKAKVIAAQLREQLLESGKQAVYQLLKKSIYNSLPGLIKKARDDRAAEAAREAAEAARLKSAVKAAAAKAAAEAARLKAEVEAKAREDAL